MKTWHHKLLQSWQTTPAWQRAILITALFLLILLPLTDRIPAFWRPAFVIPTAWMASWFMSADFILTPQGCMLVTPAASVHVILACSGARFFVLLAALFAGQILVSGCAKTKGLAIAFLFAYVTALAANTARVVFTWFAGRWAEHSLPSNFAAVVNKGAEIMVFLVFLVAMWIVFMKLIDNEQKESQR